MSKASEEAQKQLDRIVALGYPDVADMSAAAFRALARPAHPCVGGFRFGHADSVGAYARVGFPGIG